MPGSVTYNTRVLYQNVWILRHGVCQRLEEQEIVISQVMFVEVTDMMLRKSLSMAKSAKKYDAWKGAQVTHSLCIHFLSTLGSLKH